MPGTSIRPVTQADRDAAIGIFNHYVTTGFAAYPDRPVSPGFFDVLREGAYSFLVIERDGEIIGIGLVKPFLPFFTFSRTATVSTFIAPAYRHMGYGTILLAAMTRAARKKGIVMLLANISSRNPESLAFHKKHGFTECGRLHNVGIKFNERFDVVWMEKDLERAPAASR
ncbi:MAG: GNAT family N-acetyltransferase [Methanoregula sp.]|nr:MAG: GNAT family N-acetyltransferase [Methanoregula sp.]